MSQSDKMKHPDKMDHQQRAAGVARKGLKCHKS